MSSWVGGGTIYWDREDRGDSLKERVLGNIVDVTYI